MTSGFLLAGDLLAGPLCSSAPWPCLLHVRLCDVRPRFHVKQTIGSHPRAIARNGRVLLCADRPLEELPGRLARLRLQTWRRVILPGELPRPYGVLLGVRCLAEEETCNAPFILRLGPAAEAQGELRVDVGGGWMLDFAARG